ncbi:zinc finger protein 431-like [Leguminivora glycinivorella]|uniref:zinc finger protein 431-like n=1 Tax=Leguminivora glycinivorella TaxID=1035111 RepID=UPI00200D6670|nr:zinc finger protein 431-like [Leguminivora glycinivorella]
MEFVTEVSEFVRLKEEPAEPEAEPERRPPGAARVNIKEEPQNEHQSDSGEKVDCLQSTTSEYEIKEDLSCFESIVSDVIHDLCDGRVKDGVMQPESMPQIPQTASCSDMECVSEAAMLAGLYTDHDVKDELVLGAECPYRPDVTLVVHGRVGCVLRDCSVTLDRLPHVEALIKRKETTQTDTESDIDEFSFRNEFYSKEKEPLCDLCGERFSVKSDLVKHVIDHIHRPSAEQEGGGQVIAFAGQCQQEQERALCRKYAIQDCRVRLERLRHQEALAANDTQHTDTEIDAEDIHTRVDFETPTCDLCGDSFALRSDLDQHIMTHIHMPTAQRSQDPSPEKESDTEEKNIDIDCENEPTCEFCGEKFALDSDLMKHIMKHRDVDRTKQSYEKSGVHVYECDICGEIFQQKNTLKIHIKTHSTQPKSKDYKCDNVGEKSNIFNRHTQIHKHTQSYYCNLCKKRFSTEAYLKQHIMFHSDIRPYSCDICKKDFLTVNSLKKHTLRHNRVSPHSSHSCDICKEGFLTCVKQHTPLPIDVGPYLCDICGKKIMSKRNLEKHIENHSGIKKYSCDTCKKLFRTVNNLKIHTQIHSGTKPYSCDVCKKRFRNKAYIKEHMQRHTNIKQYSCDLCEKEFVTMGDLKQHRVYHTDIRPYSCDVCKKGFLFKSDLKRHTVIHTTKKPYSCDVCKKGFLFMPDLNRHILIHTDAMPYSCVVCKKRFKSEAWLKSHTRIHNNICMICNKQFAYRLDLKAHEFSFHIKKNVSLI